MIIMDPKSITRFGEFEECLAKCLIDLDVLRPVLAAIVRIGLKVMEERPERLVTESLIKILDLLLGEKDGKSVEFCEGSSPYFPSLLLGDGGAWPTDPKIVLRWDAMAAERFQICAQSRGETLRYLRRG